MLSLHLDGIHSSSQNYPKVTENLSNKLGNRAGSAKSLVSVQRDRAALLVNKER